MLITNQTISLETSLTEEFEDDAHHSLDDKQAPKSGPKRLHVALIVIASLMTCGVFFFLLFIIFLKIRAQRVAAVGHRLTLSITNDSPLTLSSS